MEFSANRSELGRTSSDIAIDDIMIEGEERIFNDLNVFVFRIAFLIIDCFSIQKVTPILVTPTRTPVIQGLPVLLNGSVNFDTVRDFAGWHTAYNNFKWIQTNGNTSMFVGSYGPGSDYKSICKFYICPDNF